MKRIIVEMDVPFWNPEVRKDLMKWIIHNLTDGDIEPDGSIIEPKKPYPLIPFSEEDDEEYIIEW